MLRWLLRLSFVVVLFAGVYWVRVPAKHRPNQRITSTVGGMVVMEYEVDSDGRLDGELTEFWPSGRVRAVTLFDHGMIIRERVRYVNKPVED